MQTDSLVVGPFFTLRYADFTVRFRGADASVRFALRTPHLSFRVSDDETPDLEVVCREGSIDDQDPPAQADEEIAWVSRMESDGSVTLFFYGRRQSENFEPYLAIRIAADYRTADAVFTPDPSGAPLPIGFPLDEHVVSAVVTRWGGCVLHACALERDGVVRVFVGHTGAGKSTIAEIGEGAGAVVLSDDRTIIRLRDGVPHAYGTPWHGSYKRGRPSGGPIEAVFLLVQDTVNRVESLTPADAFGELFVRVVLPSDFGAETLPAVDLLRELVTRCPVASLHFLPTRGAIEAAWDFRPASQGTRREMHPIPDGNPSGTDVRGLSIPQ
jgi:hypothetical protein